MVAISITWHNTVYAHLQTEPGVAKEIQEYFTFDVPSDIVIRFADEADIRVISGVL